MKTNISNILAVICICAMTSCSNEVDFGEQYKKTLYIVNSNDLLYTAEHFFETEIDAIVISVYCASSEPVTSDLKARLMVEPIALDTLNAINTLVNPSYIEKVMLPAANYSFAGESEVTIKAGTQYGTLSIPFRFTGLDPDIAYTLPVVLVSNSAGYDINPALQAIVYEVKMMNRYSGNFAGTSQESAAVIRGVQPVLKALSAHTVRMAIHNLSDDWQYINTNFMLLTIAEDGSVTITPWANAHVTDLGENYYDADLQRFELNYQFTNAGGSTFTVSEIITNINAPINKME